MNLLIFSHYFPYMNKRMLICLVLKVVQIEYPRSLSMIYKELEKRTDEDISVHISYLEIYKETGFDLLSTGARTQSAVTPFPKVRTQFT